MIRIKSKWRGRFFRYAPLILWISVILFASSTAGATTNTSIIFRPLLIWLFPDSPADTIALYHHYIRKAAHFTEYAALGFFAARAFWNSSIGFFNKYWTLCAILCVTATAMLDEYNQSFNASRTGSIGDVMLDCAGGLTMIAVCSIYRLKTNNAPDNTAEL